MHFGEHLPEALGTMVLVDVSDPQTARVLQLQESSGSNRSRSLKCSTLFT